MSSHKANRRVRDLERRPRKWKVEVWDSLGNFSRPTTSCPEKRSQRTGKMVRLKRFLVDESIRAKSKGCVWLPSMENVGNQYGQTGGLR
jgi:hypothetical protein